jgi:hypothetical protein
VDDETRARRDRCSTFLLGDGNVTPSELLASVGDGVVPDTYGEGGAVAELEAVVAELRGASAQGVWVWPRPMTTADPDVVRCELSVGRATCRLVAEDVVAALASLCRVSG